MTTQEQAGAFKMIESSPKAAWHLAQTRYVAWTVFIVVSFLILLFVRIEFAFILPFIYYTFLHAKAHEQFMRQFAETNGLEYRESLPMKNVTGRLFTLGHSRSISHAVIGEHRSHPTTLFNYQYSVGSGKHRRTHTFTVCEITFEKTIFPHILLQSTAMARYAKTDAFGDDRDVEISLEGEFKDTFRLFSTMNYEIEVLQIFTPEVLHVLKDTASNFSIEFADDRLYIYDDKTISKRSELIEMYDVMHSILDSIGPLLNRLHDDFDALHTYYT